MPERGARMCQLQLNYTDREEGRASPNESHVGRRVWGDNVGWEEQKMPPKLGDK